MYQLFHDLLAKTSANEDGVNKVGYILVSRAFFGNSFSSREFKEKCAPYATHAWQYHGDSSTLYPYLKAASAGYYHMAYILFRALLMIKHIVKKIWERVSPTLSR